MLFSSKSDVLKASMPRAPNPKQADAREPSPGQPVGASATKPGGASLGKPAGASLGKPAGASLGKPAGALVKKARGKSAMASKSKKANGASRIPTRLSSVAMAVRLLKSFSEGEAEIGVTNLSKRLNIAKSTVYRLASTLVSEGMLEQNRENEKYRLGTALFGLGALVRQRMNVSTEARPFLFDLREATNETVHLAILDRTEIMYVLNLESNQAIRMRADLGTRKPAFCTAEGRAILAFQPESFVNEVLGLGLEPRTIKTNTNPSYIREQIALAHKSGFAREDEQCELGMRSIAAPIRDESGRVIAAVGLAGPQQRLSDSVLDSFVPMLINSAHIISARLGYKTQHHS